MKVRPAGTELFHADKCPNGQRHDEANSGFSQFCEGTPEKTA